MKTAVILAGGPSLSLEQIEAATRGDFMSIAVNATYQKATKADVLYAGDYLFWRHYIADIKANFKGALWTQDNMTRERWGVNRVRGISREGLGKKDVIHLNGNSGMQAINLAYIWGHRKIVLLGFDMQLGPKGERHHHADHPKPMVQNQTFGEWMHKGAKLAKDLKDCGCEVVNASEKTAMSCFPRADWREVLK